MSNAEKMNDAMNAVQTLGQAKIIITDTEICVTADGKNWTQFRCDQELLTLIKRATDNYLKD